MGRFVYKGFNHIDIRPQKMLTSTILSICARKLCLQNIRLLCSTSYVPRGILNLKHQKNGSISIDVREPVELQKHGLVLELLIFQSVIIMKLLQWTISCLKN